MNNATLTKSQQTALDAIHSFLLDPNHNEFCLIGAAGSGKSFTVSHFCSTWKKRYKKNCTKKKIKPTLKEVHVTATTNKAAMLLGTTIDNATTIHRLLSLGVYQDKTNGEVGLKARYKGPNIDTTIRDAIIIVDESSMVNWQLHKLIHEKTERCKIIYVGDSAQLPPVKALGNLPVVFSKGFPSARLTEDMRQMNSPNILYLCNQFRDIVHAGKDAPIDFPNLPTKGKDCEVHWLSRSEVKPLIAQHFTDPTTKDKILTYTNEMCKAYSDHIAVPREVSLGDFIIGERVMVNDNFSTPIGSLFTGQELTIKELKKVDITYADNDSFSGVYVEFEESIIYAHFPTDTEFYKELLKYYKKTKQWQHFFKLQNKMIDIIRPYSLTIHKSQGSTYPTVFVDMDDALTCTVPAIRRRLLYVAISRASQQLYLVGTEDAKQKFLGT